jgi:hypothetical protein
VDNASLTDEPGTRVLSVQWASDKDDASGGQWPQARRRAWGRWGGPVAGQASTHHIEMRGDKVTKRFTEAGRGEPWREWRALTLLDQYAPGLAPRPVSSDLAGDPPTVVMSRLSGTPLRGIDTTTDQLTAMAQAITTLHQAIPTHILNGLPPSQGSPAVAVAKARAWRNKQPDLGDDPLVAAAQTAGSTWLDSTEPDQLITTPVPPVFGLSDGNLANYLWDGRRVQLLDFEDSGRSDRAFELAEVAEHISTRTEGTFDAATLIAAFDLSASETARLRDFRRLFAYSWMIMLGPGGPFHARNPHGTLERQAIHLLDLLG